jgi:hypothetical protein
MGSKCPLTSASSLRKEIIDLRSKQQLLLANGEINKKVDTFKAQKKVKHRHDNVAA